MDNQWYYGRKGQQNGPITDAQLRQLVASGQLLQTDLVWKKGMPQWVKVGQIKGLFPQPLKPVQQPASTPPPLPLSEEQTDFGIEKFAATASIPAASSNSSLLPQFQRTKTSSIEGLFGSLASRTKAAGLLIAKQTERTKLLKITLPGHYHALGSLSEFLCQPSRVRYLLVISGTRSSNKMAKWFNASFQ